MRLQHGWPGFAYGLHMSVTRFRWHSITCSVGFGSRLKFGDSCGTLPMESPHRLLLGDVTPPANGSKSHLHGAYGNEANFDTNMVIILAALLCALICALGLNSIVRCALRCGRRMVFETPEQAAARLATTGLKKRALRQIPVTVYKSETSIPATECPICLGEFMEGEKVRVLPKCNHGFHMKCIDTWLMSHSSCPTCRHSLLERPVPDSADLEAGIQSIGTGSDHRATVVGIPDEAN